MASWAHLKAWITIELNQSRIQTKLKCASTPSGGGINGLKWSFTKFYFFRHFSYFWPFYTATRRRAQTFQTCLNSRLIQFGCFPWFEMNLTCHVVEIESKYAESAKIQEIVFCSIAPTCDP